jgi:uncharacterized membrane protein YbhN (UPF0104 family)
MTTTTISPAEVASAARYRRLRLALKIVVAGGILSAVIIHVGGGPFVHALVSITATAIVAALVLAAVATTAAALRWTVISTSLGLRLAFPTAVALYYRSQFLNSVLPGGVVGDVHRAISQGRRTGRIGGASRSVVVERSAGQVVQIAVSIVILLCFGISFAPTFLGWLGLALLLVAGIGAVAVSVSSRVRQAIRQELGLLHSSLGSPSVIARVVACSIVVVGCHVATFVIAMTSVGDRVAPAQMVTLALVVLLASAVPLNVGGWGPREGVAGWAFAVAGLTMSDGVAASTLFGVLALIGVAPGVVVTAVTAARRTRPREEVS